MASWPWGKPGVFIVLTFLSLLGLGFSPNTAALHILFGFILLFVFGTRLLPASLRSLSDIANLGAVSSLRSTHEALLKFSLEGIVFIDEVGTILAVNDAMQQLLGYERGELVSQNVRMLIPAGPTRDHHDRYLSDYMQTGESHIVGIGREVQAQHKDGTLRDVDLSIAEAHHEGRRIFIGMLRDMSQRREIQRTQALVKARTEFVAAITHEVCCASFV
jgi:PAS domain S-box-containing protein